MNIPKIIAIDGPAAAGKSTLADRLADYLHYLYFDTGVMYRAVTLAAIQASVPLDDEIAVTRLANRVQIDVRPPSVNDGRRYDVLLDGEDITWQIRASEIDANVSLVSTYLGVRQAMTSQQRRIGERGHVVMVGRDIGTVVLPEAALKIYLDASVEERARRRFQELCQQEKCVSYDEILNSLKRRDAIDSSRELAPLKPAKDAVIINSDKLGEEEVFQIVKNLIK